MAITINEGYDVNAPDTIDKRLIVDRVDGTTASLVSLIPQYNYINMYVWVREEKAFYYLKDPASIDDNNNPGATVSDWTKLLSGSGGTGSAIDTTEVAFGTGTGITSSNEFRYEASQNLIVATSSSIKNSKDSLIGGGAKHLIGTSSCSAIVGGIYSCINNSCYSAIISNKCGCINTNSKNSVIIGGVASKIDSSYNSIILGSVYPKGTEDTKGGNQIIGGCNNIVSGGAYKKGGTNENFPNRLYKSYISNIIGGLGNIATASYVSSIISSRGILLKNSKNVVTLAVGSDNDSLQPPDQYPTLIQDSSNLLVGAHAGSMSIINSYGSVILASPGASLIAQRRALVLNSLGANLTSSSTFLFNSPGYVETTVGIINSPYSEIVSSTNSLIIGGTGNSICDSSNVIILGNVPVVSGESDIVYVEQLKIATASNNDSATKILVWDSDNLVKYRDSSTLGGVGSISLEPNAGLTNSGFTYATIYNTLVSETTNVPGLTSQSTPPVSGLHPLSWLRGLTAGYFSQKNIVEVLDMILFPAVPFTYTAPSLSISSSLPLPSGTILVNNASLTSNLTLTYNDGNPLATDATASQYSWFCSVNGVPTYNLIGSVLDSTSTVVTKSSVNFPINSPIKYSIIGTVSHQASTICNDTAGNPTPLPTSNQASIKITPTPIAFCSIFPYYYGRVDCNTCAANFDAGSISSANTAISCMVSSCASNNLSIPAPGFNTTQCQKGFLAVPQSLGHQQQVFFNNAVDQSTNTNYPINNLHVPITNLVLFGGSSFSVPGVVVNGISHTYSVYLFQYGSLSTANFVFSQ